MQFNKNTSIFYDKSNQHRIFSERPLQYNTLEKTKTRYFKYPIPENIDKDTELRYKPTRLNEGLRDNTFLYGTAPYKGLHDGEKHIENELRFSNSTNNIICDRSKTSEYDYFSRHIITPNVESINTLQKLPLKSYTNPISTRNDYRNTCFYTNKNQ